MAYKAFEDPQANAPAWVKVFEAGMAAWILFLGVWTVKATLSWPLVGDGTIMSYIVFLIDHGFAPYRDIAEMSFPGSYLIDWTAIHIFGTSELGWRLFDLALMLTAAAGMMLIAWPGGRWMGGVFGVGGLMVAHTAGGDWNLAERDFIMAALLIWGTAWTFQAVRRKSPAAMFWALLFTFSAISIKPTAIPFVLIPLFTMWPLRSQGERLGRYVGMAIFGALVPIAAVMIFLLRKESLVAFLDVSQRLTSVYATVKSPSFLHMSKTLVLLPHIRLILLVVGVLWVARRELWRSFELRMLLLGSALGALSFYVQRKGFDYHLYPFIAFFFLWAGMVLVETMRHSGWTRYAAALLLLFSVFAQFTERTNHALHVVYRHDVMGVLRADLRGLGAVGEQGSVQCMEMAAGCLDVLYADKMLQPTGFITDYFFYLPEKYPIVSELRSKFMSEVEAKKTRILVISDEQFPSDVRGYDKLAKWPALSRLLASEYRVAVERNVLGGGDRPVGYRVYVRR